MKKVEMLYEGKAKKVYSTENPELYIVDYKVMPQPETAQKKEPFMIKESSITG